MYLFAKKKSAAFAIILILVLCMLLPAPHVFADDNPGAEETTEEENGWFSDGRFRYFYEDGEMHTGWLEEKEDTYYFNFKGHMVTGLKKIKKKYYFFDDNGILKKEKATTKRVIYYVSHETGEVVGYRLRAVPLRQLPDLPTGCEIVSWTMMANYAGVEMDMITAANIMPRAKKPNKGFVGDPFTDEGLWIYPKGLRKMTVKYLGSYEDMTGKTLTDIKKKIRQGKVVLAWLGGLNGFYSHTVAVTGYDKKYVYYNNPWTGRRQKQKIKHFKKAWAKQKNRALSY